MVLRVRVLSVEERIEVQQQRPADLYLPGTLWTMPWAFHPGREGADARICNEIKALEAGERGWFSKFYWTEWARKRAPISVVCPDGSHWCPDALSLKGEGWRVIGDELDTITVHPSIVTSGYHGWLKNGVFTDDIEGR